MITLDGIVDAILGNLGVLFTLLLILYGGFKKWWVFGWYASELKDQNNKLEQRLDKATIVVEKQAEITQKATDLAESKSGAN